MTAYKLELTMYLADGTEKKTNWEFDKLYVHEERGTRKHYNESNECINIEPDGHKHLHINAWNYGDDWDDKTKQAYDRKVLGP